MYYQCITNIHVSILTNACIDCASSKSAAVVQVPPNFSLKDWDKGTLDDTGQYTPESDTYQIGVMLLKFEGLSATSRAFALNLKSKSLSAAAAAENPYLL